MSADEGVQSGSCPRAQSSGVAWKRASHRQRSSWRWEPSLDAEGRCVRCLSPVCLAVLRRSLEHLIWLGVLAQAAITQYGSLGAFQPQKLTSHSSGGQESGGPGAGKALFLALRGTRQLVLCPRSRE